MRAMQTRQHHLFLPQHLWTNLPFVSLTVQQTFFVFLCPSSVFFFLFFCSHGNLLWAWTDSLSTSGRSRHESRNYTLDCCFLLFSFFRHIVFWGRGWCELSLQPCEWLSTILISVSSQTGAWLSCHCVHPASLPWLRQFSLCPFAKQWDLMMLLWQTSIAWSFGSSMLAAHCEETLPRNHRDVMS